MQLVDCNLCSSDRYVLIDSHRNDKYCEADVEIRTVICMNCGLVYINPQIDQANLLHLYSNTYRLDLPSEKRLQAQAAMAEEKWKWISIRIPLNGNHEKVLDIGCSVGSLLNAFRRRGWDAYGIEPTSHYAETDKDVASPD